MKNYVLDTIRTSSIFPDNLASGARPNCGYVTQSVYIWIDCILAKIHLLECFIGNKHIAFSNSQGIDAATLCSIEYLNVLSADFFSSVLLILDTKVFNSVSLVAISLLKLILYPVSELS